MTRIVLSGLLVLALWLTARYFVVDTVPPKLQAADRMFLHEKPECVLEWVNYDEVS